LIYLSGRIVILTERETIEAAPLLRVESPQIRNAVLAVPPHTAALCKAEGFADEK
jgi:hypothetical protein